MSLSAEAATAELVRSLYAALAAHEFELARPIDGLAELLDRYDDQFREFRMETVEVVAAAERALVKVSPFRPCAVHVTLRLATPLRDTEARSEKGLTTRFSLKAIGNRAIPARRARVRIDEEEVAVTLPGEERVELAA